MSPADPFIEYLRSLPTEEGRVHLVPTLHRDDLALAAESLDFVKFVRRQKDVVLGLPPELEEQRIADLRGDMWFLPALLVYATSEAARDAGLAVTLNLVASYIYDRLKGVLPGNKPDVRIRLFHQSGEDVFEFTYEGPAEVLAKMDVSEVVTKLRPREARIPAEAVPALPADASTADPVDQEATAGEPDKTEKKKDKSKKRKKKRRK
ncbi:MAG: hypothetical protein OEY14_05705 [Myxococcales bacterium]|nr:hypothetical protein [Myxococcales bacterium]